MNNFSFIQPIQQATSFSAYFPCFEQMLVPQFAVFQDHAKFQQMMLNLQKNLQMNYVSSQALQLPRSQDSYEKTSFYRQISAKAADKIKTSAQFGIVKHENIPSDEDLLSPLCDPNKSVKAHLKDILYFITENIRETQEEGKILAEKSKYRNNASLTMIFDALLSKYIDMTMTKEDLMANIFIKALKHMKLKLKRENKKGTASSFCDAKNKRFSSTIEDLLSKIGEDKEDLDSPLRLKASSSKKEPKGMIPSQATLFEAFSSDEFCDAYQGYLNELESTLELENNRKFEKLICQIEMLIKAGDINKGIKKCKKMPWLRTWTQNALRVAQVMRAQYTAQNKIVKKEESDTSSQYFPSSSFQAKIEERSA